MSLEVLIVPMLFDLAALTHALIQDHRRAVVMERLERGQLTEEADADMRLEIEALKRSGVGVQSGTDADMRGASVLIHTDRGYDIGIKRNDRGAFDVVAHWSKQPGKAVVQQVSSDIENQVRQKYAYEKVKRELAKKGFIISDEEVQPDNTIRLVARKW